MLLITLVYKHTLFLRKNVFVSSPLFRKPQLNRLILIALFIELKRFLAYSKDALNIYDVDFLRK